jgi:hypothetical protein
MSRFFGASPVPGSFLGHDPKGNDRELYRRLLGIEAASQVERVEMQLQSGEIHDARDVTCPDATNLLGLMKSVAVD